MAYTGKSNKVPPAPDPNRIPSTPTGRMQSPFANPTAFGMFVVEGGGYVQFYALEGKFTAEEFDAYVLLSHTNVMRNIDARVYHATFLESEQIVADVRRYLVMGKLPESRFRVQLSMVQGWLNVAPRFV